MRTYASKHRKRFVRRNKKSYRRPRPMSAAMVAKIATRAVMKKVETKLIQLPVNDIPLSDYLTGSYYDGPLTCYTVSIFPNAATMPINQGVGQKNRCGNQIRTHRLILRGILSPRIFYQSPTEFYPKNTDCRPCLVKMWILWQKDQAYGLVEPEMPNFLQNGNSSISLDGTVMDTFKKVNTDLYHVCATRTFKVGNSWYSKNTIDGFDYLAGQYSANNDFKLSQRFSIDLTKFCIKNVKFNDTDNIPKCRGLYMCWEAIAADGGNLVEASYPINLSYELDYQFKDA